MDDRPQTLPWSPVNPDNQTSQRLTPGESATSHDERPITHGGVDSDTPRDAVRKPLPDGSSSSTPIATDPESDGEAREVKKKWTKLKDDDYILIIKLCCHYGSLYGKMSDKTFYQTVRDEYGSVTGKRPPGARAIQYRLNKLTSDWQRIFGEDENARHMNRIELAVKEWVPIVQGRSDREKRERETTEMLLQNTHDAKRVRSRDEAPEPKRPKTDDMDVITRTRSHPRSTAEELQHLREYFDVKIDRVMNLLEDLAKRVG